MKLKPFEISICCAGLTTGLFGLMKETLLCWQGRVRVPALLGAGGEGPVRGHTHRQPIQHQLPVDTGDTEACQAQGLP
jgi:hypothetical protein